MIEEHISIFKVKRGLCAHHNYCDSHTSIEYWYQCGYYYYEYREPRYENRASRTTVNTQIGVSVPSGEIRSFSVI
jgi:hypothetical protein